MKLKSAILAACVAAGAFCSTSAFAGWEIYDAGTGTWGDGTVTLSGPTSATVNGIPAPCTANFTLTVTGGVAVVSAATFTGSSTCTNITSTAATPPHWSVSGTASGTSVATTVGGISITILGKTCTGSVGGTLTNAHPYTAPVPPNTTHNSFTFPVTSLPVTGGGTCTVKSNPALTSSKPIQLTP
ncbi:hypothetical protein V1318_18390 [Lysobacter sp. CCNWLW3]|uniref:hypothetical protein n=1 Tax=unclassified Lysobacter TaxID=2635362 RepID=UPI002FD02854